VDSCFVCFVHTYVVVGEVIMRGGGFYYKDRMGRTRGPSELIQLKTAWGGGIIDKDTFVWGDDMDEWAPIHMVYGLEPAIATWEGLLCFYLFLCHLSLSNHPLVTGNDLMVC